jgi:hypothetical protein
VRVAELAGNPRELAVAAYHSGMAKVREAKGVPAAARAYVDRVMGYAEWYGFQTDLLGPPAPTSTSAPTADLASPSPQPGSHRLRHRDHGAADDGRHDVNGARHLAVAADDAAAVDPWRAVERRVFTAA